MLKKEEETGTEKDNAGKEKSETARLRGTLWRDVKAG